MKNSGTGIVVVFTGCKLEGEIVEKQGCKLTSEEIKTGTLTSTTPTETMTIEFKPEAGKPYSSFKLTGCKTVELNIEYKVTGTASAIPNGATLETTEASTKGLKLNGQQASFTSLTTVTMKTGEPGISMTTTEN
jgi:hypothetical protein